MRSYAQTRSAVLGPRPLLQKMALLLLIGLSLALVLADYRDHPKAEGVETTMMDVLAPAVEVIASPVQTFNQWMETAHGIAAAHSENQRLLAENEQLRQWQLIASRLEAENARLRSLLEAVPESAPHYITARIVGESNGNFSRSAIINAGVNHGIRTGQPVISSEGILGRITEVGRHSGRVLFAHDLNSRIPVMSDTTPDFRAILAGNNTRVGTLLHATDTNGLKPGERLVTSGDGGLFPRGLPVATLAPIANGPTAQLQAVLLASAEELSYVTILQQSDIASPNASTDSTGAASE